MEFSELVETRQSFHSFTEEEVDMGTVEEVIDEAKRAPTAWNLQPYDLVVLDSEEAIRKAYEASNGQEFILEAEKVILILGDERIDTHAEKAFEDAVEKNYMTREEAERYMEIVSAYSERSEEFVTGFLNRACSFLCTNLILSAWNKGIATCPVRGFKKEEISQKLNLKQQERPDLMLPLGYPDENKKKKWRRKTENLYRVI